MPITLPLRKRRQNGQLLDAKSKDKSTSFSVDWSLNRCFTPTRAGGLVNNHGLNFEKFTFTALVKYLCVFVKWVNGKSNLTSHDLDISPRDKNLNNFSLKTIILFVFLLKNCCGTSIWIFSFFLGFSSHLSLECL